MKDTGYLYRTDAKGRVAEVTGELRLKTGDRHGTEQSTSGGTDRRKKAHEGGVDDGGHLVATIFKGPGEGLNLVPIGPPPESVRNVTITTYAQ
jgi:hypothetical protein